MDSQNQPARRPVHHAGPGHPAARRSGSPFAKLDPRLMIRNPVMFVVEVVAALTTVIFVRDLLTGGGISASPSRSSSGCGSPCCSPTSPRRWPKAAARRRRRPCARRAPRRMAKRLLAVDGTRLRRSSPRRRCKPGDIVLVEAGDLIPSDGEVIEGIASVDESAITGESAPVIRESGGDRSAVTGGTRVLSDWIKVRITAAQGSTFLDRMIALVEGAERQKTPNEIALNILLAGLTIIFVFAVATIPSFAAYAGGSMSVRDPGGAVRRADPDHDRRAAVGDRHRRHGPAGALQRAGDVRPRGGGGGRRRHAAAGQDRHDHAGQPPGDRVHPADRRQPARNWPTRRSLSSLPDETPEGRSIVVLAKEKYGIRGREMAPMDAHFMPFSAQTRLSRHRLRGLVDPQGRGRCGAGLGHARRSGAGGGGGVATAVRPDAAVQELQRQGRRDRQGRRHAAGGGQGRQAARRHLPEGHRQGRHPRALRRAAPDGHPHRDDHRRQPADRRRDRRRGRASTTSWPRPRRRPS